MDAFAYLSVLLSIIIGLAITQVLQGYRSLLIARERVRPYGPPLIWSALLLVFAAQSWWASFGMVHVRDWTFAGFGLVLLQSALLYMMTALVLPDVEVEGDVELRAHYERQRIPFFASAVAMLLVSILKDRVLSGVWPSGENLASHGFFGAWALVALITRSPRYHQIAAPAMMVFTFVYIALLFYKL